MHFRDSGHKKELLFGTFNQDQSCLAVGTIDGFKIFNCEPFTKAFEFTDGGGVGIVEMLFCTSLVAVVGSGDQPTSSPRKLKILNTSNHSTICELNFVSSILAVKMNKKRMVVVMETKIHVYDVGTMKILHTIDTATNSHGIAALCPGDASYVAYPGTRGDVLIFDALNLSTVGVVEQAHKGCITCLAFSDDGSFLATTSDKGTVVRVFRMPEAVKAYEFRRGSYPARIYSLAFSRDASLLCVCSDSGTVHLFRLEKSFVSAPQTGTSPTSNYLAYLPEMVGSMWSPVRASAQVKIPTPNVPCLVAINATNDELMAVTAEGFFYNYGIDTQSGECKMLGEHTLFESKSEEVSAAYLE